MTWIKGGGKSGGFFVAGGSEAKARRASCYNPAGYTDNDVRADGEAIMAEMRKILSACRLFSQVSGAGLDQLARIGQVRTYQRGEMIFREGDPPPGVFIVADGSVRIYKLSPAGKEHVLHIMRPGQTFAEVAVLGGFPCPAFAEATGATTCGLLPTQRFERVLGEDADLPRQLLVGMAAWVHHMVDLLEDVVLRDAAGRLARYLLDAETRGSGVVELPSLKRHLASHLNLTSETLSRTLRRLTDAGLIESTDAPQRIRLLDPDALQDVADGMYPEI